jgi:hypothetical protein
MAGFYVLMRRGRAAPYLLSSQAGLIRIRWRGYI